LPRISAIHKNISVRAKIGPRGDGLEPGGDTDQKFSKQFYTNSYDFYMQSGIEHAKSSVGACMLTSAL